MPQGMMPLKCSKFGLTLMAMPWKVMRLEIRTPMAVTVIFGLLFATLLTLFLIPVLYSLFDRKKFAAAKQDTSESNTASKETVYG